jgi:hypothetical protein
MFVEMSGDWCLCGRRAAGVEDGDNGHASGKPGMPLKSTMNIDKGCD